MHKCRQSYFALKVPCIVPGREAKLNCIPIFLPSKGWIKQVKPNIKFGNSLGRIGCQSLLNQSTLKSDISQVFELDDIFTRKDAISGLKSSSRTGL